MEFHSATPATTSDAPAASGANARSWGDLPGSPPTGLRRWGDLPGSPPTGLRRWGDLPLFHAAWLFALGIILARVVWLRPAVVLLSLLLIAILCGIAAVRAQRVSWMALGPLWILLGAWCAEMEPQPAPAPVLSALSDGLLRTVEGTVVDAGPVRGETEEDGEDPSPVPTAEKPTQRIDVRVFSIESVTDEQDAQIPADGALRFTVRWPSEPDQPFRCGEPVRVVARMLPPEVYRDPGTWNRQDYLLDLGLTATATVDRDRVEPLQTPPANHKQWR